MQPLHIVLVVATGIAFIVAAAPSSRIGAGREHGRLIALVVSGAAVVGNGASLLPALPPWYGRLMVLLSLGVAVWAGLALLAARDRDRDGVTIVTRAARPAGPVRPALADDGRSRDERSVPAAGPARSDARFGARFDARFDAATPGAARPFVDYADAMPDHGAGARASRGEPRRPHLYVVPSAADIVDAEIVEDESVEDESDERHTSDKRDASATPPRGDSTSGRAVATQATFDAAGPAGARGARSVRGETYVAGHLRDYLPESKAGVTRRRSRARHQGDLRERLESMYADGQDQRGSVVSYRA